MLSDGFEEDVEAILKYSPKERQTLLFSATMPGWVKRLTRQYQQSPLTVDLVGDASTGKLAESIRSSSTPLCQTAFPTVFACLSSEVIG